jgi:hypothetical protein
MWRCRRDAAAEPQPVSFFEDIQARVASSQVKCHLRDSIQRPILRINSNIGHPARISKRIIYLPMSGSTRHRGQ